MIAAHVRPDPPVGAATSTDRPGRAAGQSGTRDRNRKSEESDASYTTCESATEALSQTVGLPSNFNLKKASSTEPGSLLENAITVSSDEDKFVMSETAQSVLRNIGDILNSLETDNQKLEQSQNLNLVEYESRGNYEVLAQLLSSTNDSEPLNVDRQGDSPKLTEFETIFAQVSKPANQSVSLNNQTRPVNGTTRSSFPSCRSDVEQGTSNRNQPSARNLTPPRKDSAPQKPKGRGAGLLTVKSAERKTGLGRASLLESMVHKQ